MKNIENQEDAKKDIGGRGGKRTGVNVNIETKKPLNNRIVNKSKSEKKMMSVNKIIDNTKEGIHPNFSISNSLTLKYLDNVLDGLDDGMKGGGLLTLDPLQISNTMNQNNTNSNTKNNRSSSFTTSMNAKLAGVQSPPSKVLDSRGSSANKAADVYRQFPTSTIGINHLIKMVNDVVVELDK